MRNKKYVEFVRSYKDEETEKEWFAGCHYGIMGESYFSYYLHSHNGKMAELSKTLEGCVYIVKEREIAKEYL